MTTIDTLEGLRTVYREPTKGSLNKVQAALDDNCRSFIAHSPFLVLGTTDGEGHVDVSPKGGPPGFVAVLDATRIAIPDLSGNNRLDSLQNIVGESAVGLLFMVPGYDETLRINGRATITTSSEVCEAATVDGRVPKVAIVVEVDEAFLHCAKAYRRAGVWDPAQWPDLSAMPTAACILRDHANSDAPIEQVEAYLEDSYQRTMWNVGGSDRDPDAVPDPR